MYSAALQARGVEILKRRLSGRGSMMYNLTWRMHCTPSGRLIYRLRGSGHRISGNGAFSGPTIYDLVPAVTMRRLNGVSTTSQDQVAPWPTPMAGNPGKPGVYNPAGNTDSSRKTVALAGWSTPTTRDHKDGASVGTVPVNGLLGRQVWLTGPARLTVSGEMLTGSSARMSDGGQLNPAFSLWLMGFPDAWGSCGARAMQSCRKSRRSS
jgi:hypothetical protein